MVRYVAGGNGYPRVLYPVRPAHQENIFPEYQGKCYMNFLPLLFLGLFHILPTSINNGQERGDKKAFPPTAFQTRTH